MPDVSQVLSEVVIAFYGLEIDPDERQEAEALVERMIAIGADQDQIRDALRLLLAH